MKIWNFGVNALQLHLFCPHISFIENAAVKTAAFSRLTTEIPQTDFCFDHLKGTPFSEGVPFIVYCGAKSEVVFSCFTFAMLDFPRP